MSTTSADSIWSMGATTLFVPAGTTNALFVQPQQGQIAWYLKWVSGGTCEILPCGFTQPVLNLNIPVAQTVANLNSAAGGGYRLEIGATTGIDFYLNGPAFFMLGTKGATASVQALLLKGQGY